MFKIIRIIYADNHTSIGVRCNVSFPGCDTNVWGVLYVSVGLCLAPDIALRYEQPVLVSAYAY